jgi:phosphohistidine phosphatase
MKQLYLIRHAKSSWRDATLDDYRRPLSSRGKKNALEMGKRLAAIGVCPDLIIASPAKRARKTAQAIARGCGGERTLVRWHDDLYLGTRAAHLELLSALAPDFAVLFLVGHDPAITEVAAHLSGASFDHIPTCGVVGLEYDEPFSAAPGQGKLLFFDFPGRWREEAESGR